MQIYQKNICIVGLGYVGLPLAVALSKKFNLIGFDNSHKRISELKKGYDGTNEISSSELDSCRILFTNDEDDISRAEIYIITVPTPVDSKKLPDTSMLESASESVSRHLSKGDIVIYESTVFPGATEEICVPILETHSGLTFNKEFSVGYSPERINPGDKKHSINNITKIISASNDKTLNVINSIYSSIIDAGTYCVDSIKVAEAAKVIENTQRDVNIALINEFTKIFNLLDIDTEEVLKAAETKWNFISFRPGLVGGHCIGVDPYYLTYKAQQLGYQPEMILAGRQLNDEMSEYIFNKVFDHMQESKINIKGSEVLILGYSFKENCSDVRNTKVKDLYRHFNKSGAIVSVFDPCVNISKFEDNDVNFIEKPSKNCKKFDVIILSVAHDEFKSIGMKEIKSYSKDISIIYDLKYIFPKEFSDYRL